MEEQNIILEKPRTFNFKIIIATIALIVVIAIVLIVLFSSPVPKDYKKLRQNLRDEDYEVESTTDRAAALEAFSAVIEGFLEYKDSGLQKESERLMKSISKTLSESNTKEILKSTEHGVFAYEEDGDDFMLVLYFDNSQSAKEIYKIIEPALEFIKENGSDAHVFEEVKRDDLVFGHKGKLLYFGTKNALKVSK